MTQTDAAVVRREVVVDAPITRAFQVFTERFGDFKSREHNILSSPIAEAVFEPRVGGHIYDRAVDGNECRVGPDPGLRAAEPRGVLLGRRPHLASGVGPCPHQ